jgi:hypothetical protein
VTAGRRCKSLGCCLIPRPLLHLLPLGASLNGQRDPPHTDAHMDRGRSYSCRLLLYTRAITPPRGPAGSWSGSVSLRRGGWSLLLVVAVWRLGSHCVSASGICPFRFQQSVRFRPSHHRQALRRLVRVGDAPAVRIREIQRTLNIGNACPQSSVGGHAIQ